MIYDDCCYLAGEQFASVGDVLAEWRRQWPALGVLLLLPEAEHEHIPALQAVFRTADVPLVGGVFPALIVRGDFLTTGAWLIRFNVMPPFFLLDDIGLGATPPSEKILQALEPLLPAESDEPSANLLFLIFDGHLPQISHILFKLWQTLQQRVRYAGGNAGSETFQSIPCLFDSQSIVRNGVLGLLLPGSAKAIVEHGFPVSRTIMRATSVEGNRIDLIDGRPAFDVYQEVIKDEYGVDLNRENFYKYAVHYPFGMVTVLDVLVRIPLDFSDDGAVYCVSDVPPNSVLRLIRAPDLAASNCVSLLAEAMPASHEGTEKSPLLTFYCAGRRTHFGQDANTEIRQLEARLTKDLVGALTLGEIDTMEEMGMPGFHHAAIVVLG
jgi:hypothetical protein